MASNLGQGSIAALGYADKLVSVPSQIFNSSIATAAFPFFADHAAAGKIDELNKSLTATIRMAAFILIPTTAILMVLSRPLIKLLFERGAFTPEATLLTGSIFALYVLQLFFAAVGILFSKIFFAFRDIKSQVQLTIVYIPLKLGLNLMFIRMIKPAAAGIAMATSLTGAIMVLVALLILRKRFNSISITGTWNAVLRIVAASAAAALIMQYAKESLSISSFSNMMLNQAAYISTLTVLGVLTYVIVCHWLRVHELGRIKSFSLKLLNL
jgi:putative peptidoglycan lipid II flippase